MMFNRINQAYPAKLAIFICLLLPIYLPAQEIIIDNAASELQEEYYLLNAGIEFGFDAELTEALKNGVTLYIDILIRLERKRKWLWDPVVKEETVGFKLERHPLTNNYIVTSLLTNSRQQFQNLDRALVSLGTVRGHALINRDILDPESGYYGYLRAKLNIEALPPALRPVWYLSRSLQSPWFRWTVQ